MRLIECEQGTAQWLDARRGRITASRIADVIAKLKKGGESASRQRYKEELVAERLSGRAEDHYTSSEMMWGTDTEPFARAAYEVETGQMVDTVGIVLHPEWDFAAASPDGLIGTDGGLEIKCPKTTTHIRWILDGVVPEEHQAQMFWNMHCAGRQWWDFMSFDPRLPDGLNSFIVRLSRDEERIAEIEEAVLLFNCEVDATIDNLRKRIKEPVLKEYAPSKNAYDELCALIDAHELI